MKEMRIMVDEASLSGLQQKLGAQNKYEVLTLALQLLSTAVSEAEDGRMIASTTPARDSLKVFRVEPLERLVEAKLKTA